jgi:hypothetical protein
MVPILKLINLNKNLEEEELNQIYIDDKLAEQLLLQEPDLDCTKYTSQINQDSARSVHFKAKSVFDKKVNARQSKTVSKLDPLKEGSPLKGRVLQSQGNSSMLQVEDDRQGTPNPWYQHQKRKLLLRYQKQLLEN